MAVKKLEPNVRVQGAARDTLRKDLRIRYEKGSSIRVLAESMGRSYGFTYRVLAEAGVTFRKRGGQARKRTRK